MPNVPLSEIAQLLRDHDSFLLLSHVRPDGDAIGSQIGLGASLEAMGKTVHYVNEDGVPESLAFLKDAEKFSQPPAEKIDYDVLVALDTGNHPRLGKNALAAAGEPKVFINIDHHKSNDGYGTHNHIDTVSPATGQIVYELLSQNDMPIPDASRDALYVAISTDTGSFQFPKTSQRTMQIAAELVGLGVDVGEINRLTYHNEPVRKVELLRALLNTLEIQCDDRLADWQLTLATKDELDLIPDDSEGLIDHIRAVDTVKIAIFFEELQGGTIRVSMRSKDANYDVCEICEVFGGGGHTMAAGIRMPGPLAEAREKVIAEARKQFS